jgi:tetratricopeptide (TPR) repeat protein
MDKEEKIAYANRKKQEGNHFFSQGKYEVAVKRYEAAVSAVKYGTDFEGEAKDQVESIKTSCELNIAAAKMKVNDWKEVITRTNNVLKENPANVKALYRKGVALGKIDNWDEAISILKKASDLDPADKAIPREIKSLEQKIRAQNQKDKHLYQKMFKAF